MALERMDFDVAPVPTNEERKATRQKLADATMRRIEKQKNTK